MAVLLNKPAQWAAYVRNPPPGYRPITEKEAVKDAAILKAAKEFITRQVKANAPIGVSEPHIINGKTILFTIEPHYHEPNGPIKPWGWHKGASTFINPSGIRATPPTSYNPYTPTKPKPSSNPYGYGMSTVHGEIVQAVRKNNLLY